MAEHKYKVLIDGFVYAENMDIKTAIILVRALFEEYYNDHSMEISIKEMERAVCNDEQMYTRTPKERSEE